MSSLFNQFLLWVEASKYILLFLGSIFEGPVLMLSSGFLFRIGEFQFIPMYLALVAGDFVADIGWYGFGYYGARTLVVKYGKYINVTPATILRVEEDFHKYHERILLISKLTMGFGFALAVLVVAGILRVPFRKYLALNLIGGFIWTLFLLAVGYFFGHIYTLLATPLKIVFACIMFIVAVITVRGVNRYLKNKNL